MCGATCMTQFRGGVLSNTILKVKNLTKNYSVRRAKRCINISFEIKQAKHWALWGIGCENPRWGASG